MIEGRRAGFAGRLLRVAFGFVLCGWGLPSEVVHGERSAAVTRPNDMVARGRSGAVATCEPHATAVGLQVLRDGGNAVDAAVAIALVLAVTHPQAGNLGGGGFLVVRMNDGRSAAFDFREKAPGSATAGMYLRPDGTLDTERVQFGASAAGVPGSPAGLAMALTEFGTAKLKDLAQPAIALAEHGIPVDQFLAGALRDERKVLERSATSRAIFLPDGEPLEQGDLLKQPDLAATLQRFADEGPSGFYRGRTAELIAAHMAANGGHVTVDDLAAYQPVRREVLR
ncbi:MAG: gamma-glutamyltransferase, partial [Planctomycetota bacterium]